MEQQPPVATKSSVPPTPPSLLPASSARLPAHPPTRPLGLPALPPAAAGRGGSSGPGGHEICDRSALAAGGAHPQHPHPRARWVGAGAGWLAGWLLPHAPACRVAGLAGHGCADTTVLWLTSQPALPHIPASPATVCSGQHSLHLPECRCRVPGGSRSGAGFRAAI